MINLDELQKVVTSGKVVTLVIMIDGKELAAISFTLDTVAFKEILETVIKAPVTIAEKTAPDANKTASDTKKIASDAKKSTGKHDKTKAHPEFNPVPAHETNDDDFNDNGSGVDEKTGADTETGEIKETITAHDINTGKATVADAIKQQNKSIEPVAASEIDDDIIPEETVVVDKKETIITDGKNEEIPAPAETGKQEIKFTDENW